MTNFLRIAAIGSVGESKREFPMKIGEIKELRLEYEWNYAREYRIRSRCGFIIKAQFFTARRKRKNNALN